MTFYCVEDSHPTRSVELLSKACLARSLKFVPLCAATYNFAQPRTLEAGDLLFRTATEKYSNILEKSLIKPGVKTLYINNAAPQRLVYYATAFKAAGLPMPKTIYHFTNDRVQLTEYVEFLGGYPIVLKIIGGSHGVGVIKVDSIPALLSLADYFVTTKEIIMMREFIPHKSHARLIVLGDQVIDSISYTTPDYDFRTNTGSDPQVRAQTFNQSYQDMAIKTVNILGIQFGGVDLLIGPDDKPYIAENNFVCNFARSQDTTGTDIAGLIIDFLLAKPVPSV